MGARNGLGKPTAGWLALAITVALALVTAFATAGLGQREPEREPANTASDDGRFRLGPDQVPSVFGLTADQAVDRLEALGLHATIKTIATCRDLPGRALWTRPGTGGLVAPGADVVVTTAAPGARCLPGDLGPDREAAWRFLDFTDGRGGPPPFAAEVSVYAGGGQSTLTAIQATDPRAWPGLATITQAVAAVDRVGAGRTVGYRTPSLGTRLGTHASCGTRPAELRGRRGLVLWIGVPTDGMGPVGTCTELTLFRDERGAIDAVLVSDTRAPASQHGPPDVVGDELRTTLTPDTATDRASWAPVLDRLTGALARSDGAGAADDACLVRGDLPTGLSDESAWRLSVPEPRGCADDWSLLVWVDDAGAIRAVDLLTGRT